MTADRRSCALKAALVASALLFVPGTASAAPDDADAHFRQGVEHYKDTDYAGALVEFKRAYALEPKYQVLYNVAEAYFQLQDYASALKTFQQYLYEGGKNISAKRRKEVDKEIQKLRRRVALVTVETPERGVAISVDDVPVGTTPLEEPILVSAGRRRITASYPGRPPVIKVIDVAGGDSPTVGMTLPAAEVKVVTLQRPSLVPPILAWGATGAVLTAAVVTGVVALGASGDLKDKLAAFPADPKAIASAHAKTAALAAATDVLGALAVAGAGVSIWLTVKVARTAPRPVGAVLPPRLVLYPTGAGLAGSF
jgi:hypothetical protein